MEISLILLLIPFFLLGYFLTRNTLRTSKAWELLVLILPVSFALMIVTVGIFGRLWGRFDLGIFFGSSLCLLGLFIYWGKGHKIFPPLKFRLSLKWSDLPLVLVLLISTFLVSAVAVKYAIYDEARLQGHFSVVESMLRNQFPPKYIAFPEIPYRYHYGFNLISAYWSKALGLPGYWGIDITAILCWVGLVGVLLSFLVSLKVPQKTLGLALLFIPLTGGMSWLLLSQHVGPYGAIFQLPHWQQMFVFNYHIHPQPMMYFFQHPMALGAVLFLTTLRFFKVWLVEQKKSLLWMVGLLLGALSLAQVVLFVTLLASLGIIFVLRFFKKDISFSENLQDGLLLLFIATGLALSLGGFFQVSHNLESFPILFSWPPGYLKYEYYGAGGPHTLYKTLVWYLSGFGFQIFFIPIALLLALRKRQSILLLLVIFCVLCFFIPQFFRYRFSWDIIKWFYGFELSGRILVAWAFLPWVARKKWSQLLAWVIVILAAVTPIRFLGDLTFKKNFSRAELRIAAYGQPKLESTFNELIQIIKDCHDCGGMMWGSPGYGRKVAFFTGIPQFQLDRNTVMMPVGRENIRKRRADLKRLEENPSLGLLDSLGIQWVLWSCHEMDSLSPKLKKLVATLRKSQLVEEYSVSDQRRECYKLFFHKKDLNTVNP